ncbi:TraR/DksA family transcriptional regulator [Parasphaerochaeta coccoides]|uniref:Transcriptional regulator, TraR/DksA family n=1 Tax=Parasphaerochaeta coccoides (strain ATCC BAA-1237 / DSM 17374 / SPN1) TaxID=760011 RepID=F4GH46_PARC1|nr:TraR/DksA C4-type zinc finger protein [Parasphaerochaeta coccoides]AEC01521.1 transcriptional regulator, TraR/DksA family [Parasphaerochaeta coccoides DSM 17374]
MTDESAFIAEMEKKLLEMHGELLEAIASGDEDFRGLVNSMGIKDSIDVASDDIMIRKMEALNKHEANKLRAVEAALARIGTGKYGRCLKCGKKIPEERLKAIPYAVLCIDCKNMEEGPGRKS